MALQGSAHDNAHDSKNNITINRTNYFNVSESATTA